MAATYRGDEETVAWLLENYPGCGNTLYDNETKWVTRVPLVCAAREGYTNIVQLLLDRGVDVNIKDVFDYTALHRVVKPRGSFTKENLDALKLLLARGADRQILTWSEKTAFDLAYSQQALEKLTNPFLLEAIELLRPEVQ